MSRANRTRRRYIPSRPHATAPLRAAWAAVFTDGDTTRTLVKLILPARPPVVMFARARSAP